MSNDFPLTPEQREHLNHMTDGRWHDTCHWCLRRRVHSGTGIAEYDAYLTRQRADIGREDSP